MEDKDKLKSQVGRMAADKLIHSGMRVGLGTGTTVVYTIRRLGEMLSAGTVTNVLAVATSTQAEMECQELRIPARTLNDPEIGGTLDLTIDGADQFDRNGFLTKGGGGALLMEKIAAYNSREFAVVIDGSKLVDMLGLSFPIPVEVIPEARQPVIHSLVRLGGRPEARMALRKKGLVITDKGNVLLDVSFEDGGIADPAEMEKTISCIPGVVACGIFTRRIDHLFVGYGDGRVEYRRCVEH